MSNHAETTTPFSGANTYLRAVISALLITGIQLSILRSVEPESETYEAPFSNDLDAETYLFTIPGPRGLILDRRGEVFARNRTITRAALIMGNLGTEDAALAVAATKDIIENFPFSERMLKIPDEVALQRHWEHRRRLPLLITEPLSSGEIARIEAALPYEPALHLQIEYQREYPQKNRACHTIGYVSREILRPSGPYLPKEAMWPEVTGADGIEQVLDHELAGKPGLTNVVFDDFGGVRYDRMLREPEPGLSVVLSINLKMQELAENILMWNRRPGAFVAVDAETGDLLALANYPTFDIGKFVPNISPKDLLSIQETPGNPFFPRAHGGRYPPGSIFKPIVALGAMESGKVKPTTRYHCRPSLRIAGRTFKNWHRSEVGNYSVREALMRSSNTWFYQAALKSGSKPLIQSARAFGLGVKPVLPLDGVTAGLVPDVIVAQRRLANFSIGQGDLLVSPLQMALAMSGIANGGFIPKPRLVMQYQTPPPNEEIVRHTPVLRPNVLEFDERALKAVRDGMKDVVQADRGTGKSAAAGWPKVAGKTGTAQWTSEGKSRYVVWFSGYIEATSPRIAFAVMCEGRPGEHIFGGKMAAPMAGKFIRTVYQSPTYYGVSSPGRRPKSNPSDGMEAELDLPITLAKRP